jgi:hypothetical protein
MKVSEVRKQLGLSPKRFNRLFGDIPSFRQPRLSELKSKLNVLQERDIAELNRLNGLRRVSTNG